MDLIATSCSNGIILLSGQGKSDLPIVKRYGDSLVLSFSFSLNGFKYAYTFGDCVRIHSSVTHDLLTELPYKNVAKCTFSPDGTVIVIYQNYNSNVKGPNMRFIQLDSGTCLKEVTQTRSDIWKPQWTNDAAVCVRFSQEEIHLFQNNMFDQPPSYKIEGKHVKAIALSPRGPNPNLAMFVAGQKSQPSFVALHAIQDGQDIGMIVRKTFFKADYVNLMWSNRGTDLLALATINESDKSYYGEQKLYFLTTHKGGETSNVVLPNDDSISDVQWLNNPLPQPQAKPDQKLRHSSQLFAICHGQLPSTVTVFGTDCEPKFSFGSGPWNTILCNPLGNLIILGGFGNIPGNVSIWDIAKKQKISSIKCEDTTHIAWCDDGIHFIAATTTPRLRVNNGFKVYNYKGEEVSKWVVEKREVPKAATADLPAQIFHELHHVIVCPLPEDRKPKVSFQPEKGSIDPQVSGLGKSNKASKANAYVPPSLRNSRADPKSGRKTGPIGVSLPTANASAGKDSEQANRTKQINNLKSKLKQIEKLKADQATGKKLDHAQIQKIENEESLIQQLTQLRLKQ